VRADSKIPKGDTSFKNESILDGLAELLSIMLAGGLFQQVTLTRMLHDLHFNNAAGGANIQHLASKLMGEVGDGLQVLVLVSESLTSS
jgi:hypothetical protein